MLRTPKNEAKVEGYAVASGVETSAKGLAQGIGEGMKKALATSLDNNTYNRLAVAQTVKAEAKQGPAEPDVNKSGPGLR